MCLFVEYGERCKEKEREKRKEGRKEGRNEGKVLKCVSS